jgi:hypothetical protein
MKTGYLDYIGIWVVISNIGKIYVLSNPEDIEEKFINKEVSFKPKGSECTVYENT